MRLADRGSPAQAVSQFVEQRLPMLVLADVGNVAEARDQLTRWIEDGGVLVRFAGPRLAAGDDDLVPVKLRRGGRILGGSLSWDQPQQLAPFARESPFFGVAVPTDVTVNRQVLAEPDATLTDRTWAALADGTPLVTAQRRGKGLVVLFHVTADTRWSDLPLSGTFVEMLKRIVSFAGSVAADGSAAGGRGAREVLPPTRVLDGFGTFGPPPATARPVPTDFGGRATFEHPPGFYGPPEGLLAINALAPADRLAPLDVSALNARREAYRMSEPEDLRGPILLAALALLALDALVVFLLAGGIGQLVRRRRPAAAALAVAILAATLPAMPQASAQSPAPSRPQSQPSPRAQSGEEPAVKSTLETKLAYVVTGDAEVDRISKAGLQGLTLFLAQRTALEPGEPIGLDPARDELAFYPLIYWPIVASAPKPTREALEHIDAYMKQGGTVLFDTRDAVEAPVGPGGANRGPGMQALRTILASLDIPELEPVPARPCADEDILSVEGLSRSLRLRPALGRGTASRERGRAGEPSGPRRRRRFVDHHHLERFRRRVGDASGRPGHAAARVGRAAPARVRLPRRRQHRDVYAHRQLQGRSGAYPGAARAARAVAMATMPYPRRRHTRRRCPGTRNFSS